LIDFDIIYNIEDLSAFCEHAQYENYIAEPKNLFMIHCKTCNYKCFLTDKQKLNVIQTLVNGKLWIWIQKGHTLTLRKEYQFQLVRAPFDMKTFNQDITSRLVLL
jgi:hypothetical protein